MMATQSKELLLLLAKDEIAESVPFSEYSDIVNNCINLTEDIKSLAGKITLAITK